MAELRRVLPQHPPVDDYALPVLHLAGAMMSEGELRGMDLLSPVRSHLELTPHGRGDWMPSLDHGR